MALNPYDPPSASDTLFWWNTPKSSAEPQRLLDDVAHAVHWARQMAWKHSPSRASRRLHWLWGRTHVLRRPRKIYRTLWIDELFEQAHFEFAWNKLGEKLRVELPLLVRGSDQLYWQ